MTYFNFKYNNCLLNFNNFIFKYLIKKSTTVHIFLDDILLKERKVVVVVLVIEGILGVYVFFRVGAARFLTSYRYWASLACRFNRKVE